MNDKYAKEIAKELRLIRIELQKVNNPPNEVSVDGEKVGEIVKENESFQANAGERVTIK